MDPKTNPPAFPYAFNFPEQPGEPSGFSPGMSLRDYFAGQALIGILQDKRYAEVGSEAASASEIARYAGRIADEMIAERKVIIRSPLGTQQLACGNRVPVENPTTIRVQ